MEKVMKSQFVEKMMNKRIVQSVVIVGMALALAGCWFPHHHH